MFSIRHCSDLDDSTAGSWFPDLTFVDAKVFLRFTHARFRWVKTLISPSSLEALQDSPEQIWLTWLTRLLSTPLVTTRSSSPWATSSWPKIRFSWALSARAW